MPIENDSHCGYTFVTTNNSTFSDNGYFTVNMGDLENGAMFTFGWEEFINDIMNTYPPPMSEYKNYSRKKQKREFGIAKFMRGEL